MRAVESAQRAVVTARRKGSSVLVVRNDKTKPPKNIPALAATLRVISSRDADLLVASHAPCSVRQQCTRRSSQRNLVDPVYRRSNHPICARLTGHDGRSSRRSNCPKEWPPIPIFIGLRCMRGWAYVARRPHLRSDAMHHLKALASAPAGAKAAAHGLHSAQRVTPQNLSYDDSEARYSGPLRAAVSPHSSRSHGCVRVGCIAVLRGRDRDGSRPDLLGRRRRMGANLVSIRPIAVGGAPGRHT